MHATTIADWRKNLAVHSLGILMCMAWAAAADAANHRPPTSVGTPVTKLAGLLGGAALNGLNLKLDLSLTAGLQNNGGQDEETEDGLLPLLAKLEPAEEQGSLWTRTDLAAAPPDASVWSASLATDPAKPAPVSASDTASSSQTAAWHITPADKTLNAALARWAAAAGWQLVWELPVDYTVDTRTTLHGTFGGVIETVVTSMGTAEIPIKAIFYEGNKVLRILAKGSE